MREGCPIGSNPREQPRLFEKPIGQARPVRLEKSGKWGQVSTGITLKAGASSCRIGLRDGFIVTGHRLRLTIYSDDNKGVDSWQEGDWGNTKIFRHPGIPARMSVSKLADGRLWITFVAKSSTHRDWLRVARDGHHWDESRRSTKQCSNQIWACRHGLISMEADRRSKNRISFL